MLWQELQRYQFSLVVLLMALCIQEAVENSYMEQVNKETLLQIEGGTSFSATMVNSFTTLIKALFTIGQNLGESIRRIKENTMCPLE